MLHRTNLGAGRPIRSAEQETTMRNLETAAFGAVALVAQVLVVATIFIAA
jgi:hypothetical protein